jgi:DNA-binding response OmpR family regulator
VADLGARRIAVIVEDDADIRNLIEAVLVQAGFETFTAADGLAGVEAVREHRPVVTTLDISLPGIDGFEVARRLRAFSDTYIVMLTARSDEIDTLMGLEAGADDYLLKPFRPRELRARIEAMMRRPPLGGHAQPAQEAPTPTPTPTPVVTPVPVAVAVATGDVYDDGWLEFDGLRLQPDMRIVEVDGASVDMTRSEFELLASIMEARGRVVTKDALVLATRADGSYADDYVSQSDRRTLEVHLANLRRKIGEDTASPRWLETVRGVGYRLKSSPLAR